MINKPEILGIEDTKMMKFAWSCFLNAHGDECDIGAVLDEIIKTISTAQRNDTYKETLGQFRNELVKIMGEGKLVVDAVNDMREFIKALQSQLEEG